MTQIDHLVTTHWHGDHVGGLAEFARRMPIRHFIDHGANVQPGPGIDEFLTDAYPKLYEKGTHTVARPGDRIALAGLDVRVVSSAGQVLTTPLPGAGSPNPYCAAFKPTGNSAEDAQSVGTYVRFGQFRTLHPGDLPTAKEFELMCPNSRIDPIDVLLGLHHGQDTSNSEVLVHAIRPRVAIMNNGTRRPSAGRHEDAVFLARSRGRLADAFLASRRPRINTNPGMFIANVVDDQPAALPIAPAPLPAGANAPPPPAHDGQAYWIKVSAQRRRDVHRHKRAKRLFKNICAPIARAPLIYAPPGCC